MKKGLNFQGLRPEGDFELCLSLELSGFGNVGGKGGGEKRLSHAFFPLLSHCYCAVGKGERHDFLYFNTNLCREACSQLWINELPCLWEIGWWSSSQSNGCLLPPPFSAVLHFPASVVGNWISHITEWLLVAYNLPIVLPFCTRLPHLCFELIFTRKALIIMWTPQLHCILVFMSKALI